MPNQTQYIDMNECGELGHLMRRRPPFFAHATVTLLAILITAALAWLMNSRANLVVIADGRVRPLDETHPVVTGEKFAAATGGRVAHVGYTQGQHVNKGDTLIRFDTTWLDRQIALREQTIANGVVELDRLRKLERDMDGRFQSKLNEAHALVKQAEARLAEAQLRRDREIDLAKLKVRQAEERLARIQKLTDRHAASPEELTNARTEVDLAKSHLAIAELPVDTTQVDVLQRQADLVDREYRVQTQEFAVQQDTKSGEVKAARIELATLLLERKQSVVTAPVPGIVITPEPKIGDVVPSGHTVAELARQGDLRLDVAIPAADVGHIRVGMPVRVKLEAYDYQDYGTLDGRVTFVSPDSVAAEPAGDTPALPVFTARVQLDSDTVGRGNHTGQVKIGMAGRAEIYTEQRSLFTLLAKRIDRAVRID